MQGIVIFTVEPSRAIVVAIGGDGWSTVRSVACSLSFSSAILNTMRTFCGPASNVPCQLPVIFWASSALPSNAARAIIHKVNFFIDDSPVSIAAQINRMSQKHWLNAALARLRDHNETVLQLHAEGFRLRIRDPEHGPVQT